MQVLGARAAAGPVRAAGLLTIVSALAVGLALPGCKSDPSGDAPAPASAMPSAVAALVPGEEREVDEGVFMLMHRIAAQSPTEGGWHRATSTQGGFSVEVPLAFNDFRVRSKATDGVDVQSHTVGGKSPAPGLLSWLATCIVRADGTLGPSKSIGPDDFVETKGIPPKAIQRTLRFPDRLCVLVVEAQGTDPLPSEADQMRFLKSFARTP